jgi:DNA-binding winged helix-turn-helix (wHTH) protein
MAADPALQPSLQFDIFELDCTNCLTRSGLPVDAPPQALKILQLLATRPKKLVTRQEIKEALWPGQSYGDFDSRLNFTIRKLREALGDNAEQPRYVKTIRNAGYMFIAPLRTLQATPVRSPSLVDPELIGTIDDGGPRESPTPNWSERQKSQLHTQPLLLTVVASMVVASVVIFMLLVVPRSRNQPAISSALAKGRFPSGTTDVETRPAIASVSAIAPDPRQQIVIHGRGFGLHVPYARTDSPYLAIRDQTTKWAAGRLIPQNWDEVMVDVETWTDAEIVVSGFSGDYGKNGWKLTAGDDVEIAIWNPQSGVGPALYHVTVVSLEAAR